jgi:flagellar hook-associated protein 2
MINNAAIGVTASIANDGDGRPNLLQLSSGSALTLGSGADTSNFLSMTHLLASPGGTTRTSTRNLGTVSATASLDEARLATALSSSTGAFSINGVSIAYDAATDSLSSMISKINASGANVTASYDAIEDKLRLSSNATGAISIALADTTGNFLAATGLLAASQSLGGNASYKINGGATQYSTTNEVSNAVPGVSLTLKQTTSSAITVGVSSDAASVRNRLQSFVAQFNSTMGIITDSTKFAEDGKSGTLIGDTGLQGLGARLRGFVGGVSYGNDSGLNSLASIGVTFGAIGSAPGQTGVLTLDNAKFDAAFASNPEGVIRLLTRFTATGTLDPASFGSLTGVSGAPTSVPDSGKYTLASSTNGSLTVTFTADNGATPVVQTLTISPGEVNTTIIPGMTLTFAGALIDGTDTIVVGAAEEGIGKAFHEYLDGMTRAGGVMQGRDSEIATRISDLNKHIERMETRIEAKRQSLIQRYAALEVTMQRLQGQQSALTNFVNQLSGNRRSS